MAETTPARCVTAAVAPELALVTVSTIGAAGRVHLYGETPGVVRARYPGGAVTGREQ